MLRRVTMLTALVLLPLAVQAQTVHEVTVKEILAIHPDSLQKAIANQATLTNAELETLLKATYQDSTVRFTAVVLTDVYDSGNASPNNGIPGRIHLFLRDVNAMQDGEVQPGYTLQVVDGNWQTNGWQNYAPGSVVTVTGAVTAFNGQIQVAPTTVTLAEDHYSDIGLGDAIMEPIAVSITDLYEEGPEDPASNLGTQSMMRLENWNPYRQEYVTLSNMTVDNSSEWTGGRFNIAFRDNASSLAIEFMDISLRYRNDRVGTDYESAGFNVRETPFVVPAIGSRVNVSGFLLYNRNDAFGYFNPNPNLRIVPMTDDDLELLPSIEPTVSNVSTPSGLVTGEADVAITADVVAGEGRTLATVELLAGPAGGEKASYPMTLVSGTQYRGTLPASALEDGVFVEYVVRATDTEGDAGESVPFTFRVLAQIDAISDIQMTATGLGRSPLLGMSFEAASGVMDLEVVLQSDPDSTNLFVVQDASAAWSGIFLAPSNDLRALSPGTIIRITGATVAENFDVTQLNDVTFTVVGPGTPLPPVEVTTTELLDPSTAESYEGVMVRFSNVEITSTNADAPANHGEWLFATVGTTDAVRADDQSAAIPTLYNDDLTVGTRYSYIQGVWYYSFNNYKLLPLVLSDIVVATSADGGELPEGFGLGQSYPNPARAETTIPFSLETAGYVTLDVFDTLGRRVARLAAEDRPAGQQQVTFDTRDLGAGLYLVRLSAGNQVETRSLVVVR